MEPVSMLAVAFFAILLAILGWFTVHQRGPFVLALRRIVADVGPHARSIGWMLYAGAAVLVMLLLAGFVLSNPTPLYRWSPVLLIVCAVLAGSASKVSDRY